MRDQDESQNVEDGRSSGGGGFQFRPVHGIGLGTVAVALIGGWIFGVNPLQILGLLSGDGGSVQQTAPSGPAPPPPANDAQAKFVSKVLHSTETVWGSVFQQMGRTYEQPKLRLF